jgi:hypothetical protein
MSLVGAGEDISLRALGELLGQLLGASKVELHLHAGVLGLELPADLGKGFGQRGGGKDGQGNPILSVLRIRPAGGQKQTEDEKRG